MSIPINHHHVSQCHSKNFFNEKENKIYLYDKTKDNHFYSSSTKSIFSEDFSNSTLINGKVNHELLERELKLLAEDDFPEIIKTIEHICQNPTIPHGEHLETLCRLTMYGLIGEMRHPQHKKRNDDILAKIFNDFKDISESRATKQLDPFFQKIAKTKYSNVLSYIDVASRMIKNMGELDFSIFLIKSNDLFLLPDTTSFHIRAKTYQYNPHIEEIVCVGIPLTDKLFILTESEKALNTSSRFYVIEENDSKQVLGINKYLFDFAQQVVATSNKGQLKKIVEMCKTSI